MFAATMMGGPCFINDDVNSSSLNPWTWNNIANVLYIDQPVQTGFSYDVLVNGTLDQISGDYTTTDFSFGIPKTNTTFLIRTFLSQLSNQNSNNLVPVVHWLYQFTQAWVDVSLLRVPRTREVQRERVHGACRECELCGRGDITGGESGFQRHL
jgi:carboxypeptidase D